jgi:hypothetical protein
MAFGLFGRRRLIHRVSSQPDATDGAGPATRDEARITGRRSQADAALQARLDLLRFKLGVPQEVFDASVRPLVAQAAKEVLGDDPDGLITRLDLALCALDVRRARVLPIGASPEIAAERSHRWTYAVLVAALLDGVSQRIEPRGRVGDHQPFWWLMRVVPAQTLVWLTEDAEVIGQLESWLSDPCGATPGALADIMAAARAAAVSTRASGSMTPALTPPTVPAGTDSVDGPAVNPSRATTAVACTDSSHLAAPIEAHSTGPADPMDPRDPTDPTDPAAFLSWLRRGVADGSLPVNRTDASLHRVWEGLLLVSPALFRIWIRQAQAKRMTDSAEWLPAVAGNAQGGADKPSDPLIRLQRRLLRHAPHLRGVEGLTLHTYARAAEPTALPSGQGRDDKPFPASPEASGQTIKSGKQRRPGTITGIVLLDPSRWLDTVPPVNPSLERVVPVSPR